MTPATEKVEVTVRTNEGEDKTVPASDVADALKIAKMLRTPDSYMVCVVQDGKRTMRWDRPTVVGENQWRKEDPGAFEQLGAARTIRVVRSAPQQDLLGDEVRPLGLRCYQVGDSDWFAATCPEQALELMREQVGDDEEYEVELTTQTMLDARWREEDEPDKDAGSLREWLAEAKEPGWIGGT
ncbi:type IV pilus biogenesis protein PilI [Pseudomonas cannabina]|uniref:type IV pilus biogenesis protein PilI n=1 Tax=Pseudomonas cannabina TaxID=86840 RepID=UPI001604EFEC|nr:hypothetical protein [Pseudomonas cannabina]